MLERPRNHAEIFLKFFLTFISLFSLIVYFFRFKINSKPHSLTYMLTRVSAFITQRFHLLIFACLMKRMVLPIIMKTEKNFKKEPAFLTSLFKNCSTDIWSWRSSSSFLKFLEGFDTDFLMKIFLLKKNVYFFNWSVCKQDLEHNFK